MSASRTILKIIAVIIIASAVLDAAFGVFLLAGSGLMAGQTIDAGTETLDAANATIALGVFVVVSSVISLVVGIFAWRGAKDPAKIRPFKIMAIIDLVLCFVQMLMFAFSGQIASFGISGWVQLLALALCVLLAFNISKQNEK